MSPLPAVGARPRQARSHAARERYFEATMARFATDGVAEARVRDIVDDAGGSWGSYHHYFPRKEDVLIEHVVRRVRRLRPLVDRALGDQRRSVRGAVELVLIGFATPEIDPFVHGAAIREAMSHPQRLAEMLEGDLPPVGLVAVLLEEGQRRGQVNTEADPFSLGAVLTAGTMFPVIQTAYGMRMSGFERAVQPDDVGEAVRRSLAIAWRAVAA